MALDGRASDRGLLRGSERKPETETETRTRKQSNRSQENDRRGTHSREPKTRAPRLSERSQRAKQAGRRATDTGKGLSNLLNAENEPVFLLAQGAPGVPCFRSSKKLFVRLLPCLHGTGRRTRRDGTARDAGRWWVENESQNEPDSASGPTT